MNALYSFPPGALLGIVAAILLFALCGQQLWHLRDYNGIGHKVTITVAAAGYGSAAALLTGVVCHTLYVHTVFRTAVPGEGLPNTNPVAIAAGVAITAIVLMHFIHALVNHKAVIGAVLLPMVFMCFATLADVTNMYMFSKAWQLLNSVGWLLSGAAVIGSCIVVSIIQVRTFRRRAYDAGHDAAYNELQGRICTHEPHEPSKFTLSS